MSSSDDSDFPDISAESVTSPPPLPDVETLKDTLTEETEAFAKKLIRDVKPFIKRTVSSTFD
uniref:Uncharacterized protein n=2 Tax=Arabidopsis thaliana TaxID=3702 RepID=Q1PE66_ARATH|nr:hypothetical protein At4g19620 [Arabidopsis thaliana]